ncbi:MAG: hypothetical protein IKU37_08050 [Candidatus Gastranaerophilales bacterium]|nr:hypothetical protein [Candidatus Gastranaerophilales bacterium]
MEQIQNLGRVSFQANAMSAKEAEQVSTPAMSNPIENGDEKSMSALQWAGVIGAATLAVGGIAYAAIRGKGIDSKYVKFDKAGKATYQKAADGSELGKISKWIKGIDKNGNIKSGKVVKYAEDGSKSLTTKFNDGKRISQKVFKDGKTIKLEYNSDNKLIKSIKDGVTTTFEYGADEATKGKLVKKTVGNDVFTYKYDASGMSEIVKNDKEITKFTKLGKKIEKVEYPNGTIQKFDYDNEGKLKSRVIDDKDGKTILNQVISRNDNGIDSIWTKEVLSNETRITCKKDGLIGTSVKTNGENKTYTRTFQQGDKILVGTRDNSKGFEYKLNGQKVDSKNEELGKLLGVEQSLFDRVGQSICQ